MPKTRPLFPTNSKFFMKVKKNIDLSLYVITDKELAGTRSVIDIAKQAIFGGATTIQLRDKIASDEDLITIGKELIGVARGKASIIVNDNVKVAIEIGAEGVHVGQKDMPALEAKEIIKDMMILGVSASSVGEAKEAWQKDIDLLSGTSGDILLCALLDFENRKILAKAVFAVTQVVSKEIFW